MAEILKTKSDIQFSEGFVDVVSKDIGSDSLQLRNFLIRPDTPLLGASSVLLFKDLFRFKVNENLLSHNPENWELGEIDWNTGEVVESDWFIRTKNFIPINDKEFYTGGWHSAGGDNVIFFYDSEKNFIGTIGQVSSYQEFKPPKNTKYFRFLLEGTDISTSKYKLEKGTVKTDWSLSKEDIYAGLEDDTLIDSRDYFKRYFRYSCDGVHFSDPIEVTQANIQSIEIDESKFFDIEFEYKAVVDVNNIEFLGISFRVSYEPPESLPSCIDTHISDIISYYDPKVLRWSANVLRKIYEKGIVPDFIERTDDFIEFFTVITRWFAVLVSYSRELVKIEEYEQFLREFLAQKGVITGYDTTKEELLEMLESIIPIFRERGVKLKENKEVERLLDSGKSTSIIALLEEHKRGFYVNSSSPLYRGLSNTSNTVFGFEKSPGFTDLSKYPINPIFLPNFSIDQNKNTTAIFDSPSLLFSNPSIRFEIDPRISYEIDFRFSILNDSVSQIPIQFSPITTDGSDYPIPLIRADGNSIIPPIMLPGINVDTNKIINMKGIVYGYGQENLPLENCLINIGFGCNLRFNQAARFMSVLLQINTSNITRLLIFELKIRPLLSNRAIGFVSLVNPILTWLDDTSQNLNKNELIEEISKNFIPYNSTILPMWFDETIEVEYEPLVISKVLVENITCYGLDNGKITIQAVGGKPPLQYALDDGSYQNSNEFTDLPNGSFVPKVIDDDNVVVVGGEVTIIRPDAIVINDVTSSNVTMYGSNNGSITVNASGGTSPLVYSIKKGSRAWSSWQHQNVFTKLIADTYKVRVSDANNCPATESSNIIITQPAQLILDSVVAQNITCYELNDGIITINVSSGVPPYQYRLGSGSWKNSNVFTGLINGSYTPYAKDSTGYQVTGSQVSIVRPPKLVITLIAVSDVTTYGGSNGSISVTAIGGTGQKQYSYRGAFSLEWGSWQNSNLFIGLKAGNYLVRVKDANGCTEQSSNIITISQPAQTTTTTTTPIPIRRISIMSIGSGSPIPGTNYYIEGADKINNNAYDAKVGDVISLIAVDKLTPPQAHFKKWVLPDLNESTTRIYGYTVPSGTQLLSIQVQFEEF